MTAKIVQNDCNFDIEVSPVNGDCGLVLLAFALKYAGTIAADLTDMKIWLDRKGALKLASDIPSYSAQEAVNARLPDRSKGLHVAQKDPNCDIRVSLVSDDSRPVSLCIPLKHCEAIAAHLEEQQKGTNMNLLLNREAALKLASDIETLARDMEWLPRKHDGQA